ncbi:MAG: ATP-binding cassette domain-containing protein, partial [Crocinitomicaceae bacterium]|nr:ATP-binding cassette domain-containing protein [Crocinitomicaceae bacterium]
MPILSVEKLTIKYGDKTVVNACSFSQMKGEITVILGESGDGKTSLLKAVAGLLPIHSGKVMYKGAHLKDALQKLVPGHEEIKLVNQDFALDKFH